MKLTVNKYLNARIDEPSTNASCRFYRNPGDILEIDNVVAGTEIDGNAVWYHCKDDGCFYWSGGGLLNGAEVFGDWNTLADDIQKCLLDSMVNDKQFWLEKKVIGYIGCAWGYKNDDQSRGLALTIFVDQKVNSNTIGETIWYKGYNVPVDIKETALFHHQYIDYNTQGHPDIPVAPDTAHPIEMGGSISISSNETVGYGTRSMLLKNKEGKTCLMTCFHVLLNNFKSAGSFPVNPAKDVSAETPAKERIPFKVRSINKPLKVIAGRYSNIYDFAVVEIPEGLQFINKFHVNRFSSFYKMEELKSLIHQTVTMAGATSFLQTGKILDVKASLPVNDNHVCNNVIVAEMMSKGGDSGAPVVDKNGKLVGIIVSGNEKNRTLILPVTYLFSKLHYTLL